MDTIGQRRLRSFLSHRDDQDLRDDDLDGPWKISCSQVRTDIGVEVRNYMDLAQKVATVQYHNPDYVFLYRGQSQDYLRRSASTLKPSIFRSPPGLPPEKQDVPSGELLERRYKILQNVESALVSKYPFRNGRDRLKRQRILRWAIIQHYEICETPLLDVTHSLRIAASFASLDADRHAFVFMLGLPNMSAAITASSEAGLQVVRLSTACPPEARRPHLQEGYLVGEYPDVADVSQKQNYEHAEFDFGRRLVAKFRFNPATFWVRDDPFPPVPRDALYPDFGDELVDLKHRIRSELSLGQ